MQRPELVERSRKRAERAGVGERAHFVVQDRRRTPASGRRI
jgi:hypothetical protein